MQASEQNTERLHQEASTHYLQGKFAEALAVWQQILVADPEDERAKEGLRLCELLTEDGAISAPVPEAPAAEQPPPVPTMPEVQAAPIEDPIDFELPQLDVDLPPIEVPDPARQAEGLEMEAAIGALDLAGDVPTPEVEIPSAEVEFVDPVVDPAADAAAAELQTRVHDLLSEASVAYGRGDIESARGSLARVFILDEKNAQAHELQEMIEGGVPAETEKVDVADLDAPEHNAAPGEFDLAADDPQGAPVVVAPVPEPQTLRHEALEAEPEPAIEIAETQSIDEALMEPLPDFDDGDGVIDDDEMEALDPSGASAKRIRLPQLDAAGGSKKTLLIVVGVVAVVAVAVGIGFWMKLKSVKIRDGEAPPIARVEQPAAPSEQPPAETATTESGGSEPAGAAAAAGSTEDVDTLLAKGRDAFNAGEFAAAIVAYHAVIEQDVTNIEANERLVAATEAYKQKQDRDKQWLAATALFRDGEFRSSLKMLYRLETENPEDRQRLERYKENGWYNMGLQALRTGHCDLARSHLNEAEQIDPQDADIATALALSDTCDAGSRKTGFQRAVKVINLRGLDDSPRPSGGSAADR